MDNIKELQSIVNPSFKTAKDILFLLLSGGDPDAIKLAPYLNLTSQSKPKPEQLPPQEILNCYKIGQMVRFNINNSVALKSGKQTIIDLPCGYATRCFKVANSGLNYYGLDLPIVIDEMKELTSKIITEEQKPLISFNAVDATNYYSMREAPKDIKGEICIITEGLFVYLNDSELESFCGAIHKLLSEFGGCWMTADVGKMEQIYALALGVLYKEVIDKESPLKNDISSYLSKFHSYKSTLAANNFEGAKDFFEKKGFIVKKEPISNYIDKIKDAPEDKQEELKKAFSNISIWTLTIDKKDIDRTNIEENIKFNLESKLTDGIFIINIEGRLDTLTAPELLKIFQENKGIKQIKFDVNKMTFISSAGVRVLEIMMEELNNKEMFEIFGAKGNIKEILEKNGFKENIK